MSVIQQIQIRRGTAAEWTSANPVLLSGEQGLETDTRKTKIGNGTTAWNALGYQGLSGAMSVAATAMLQTQTHDAVTLPDAQHAWARVPAEIQDDLLLRAEGGHLLEVWSNLYFSTLDPSAGGGDGDSTAVDFAIIVGDAPVYWVGAGGPTAAWIDNSYSSLDSGTMYLVDVDPAWVVDGHLRLRLMYTGSNLASATFPNIYGRAWFKNLTNIDVTPTT